MEKNELRSIFNTRVLDQDSRFWEIPGNGLIFGSGIPGNEESGNSGMDFLIKIAHFHWFQRDKV